MPNWLKVVLALIVLPIALCAIPFVGIYFILNLLLEFIKYFFPVKADPVRSKRAVEKKEYFDFSKIYNQL